MNDVVLIFSHSDGIVGVCDHNTEFGYYIPWNCKNDVEMFARETSGHPVIMGANTWRSLGEKPLLDRFNVVVSREIYQQYTPALVVGGLGQAVNEASARCGGYLSIYIIGGASILEQAISHTDFRVTKVIESRILLEKEKHQKGGRYVSLSSLFFDRLKKDFHSGDPAFCPGFTCYKWFRK